MKHLLILIIKFFTSLFQKTSGTVKLQFTLLECAISSIKTLNYWRYPLKKKYKRDTHTHKSNGIQAHKIYTRNTIFYIYYISLMFNITY